MKAIKYQLKMRADMAGCGLIKLLEYIYDQPIIAGHPKQVPPPTPCRLQW